MKITRRILSLVLISLVALMGACDSTVGLDPTQPTFTKLLVPGVCTVQEEPTYNVEMSVMLLDGKQALVPDSKIARTPGILQDTLSFDDFEFQKAPQDGDTGFSETGVLMLDDGSLEKTGTLLQPNGLRFEYPGGEERKRDKKLVVLVMDNSGSIRGLDPVTDRPQPALATDQRDERITFFRQLVQNLDKNHYVSLVKMNDRGGNIAECSTEEACADRGRVCSNPTVNRDPVICGLGALEYNEFGLTPMNQTLKQVMTSIIDIPDNQDLNPVVIVFTDGLESGDMSGDMMAEGQALDIYKRGVNGKPVPLLFVHLQASRSSTFPQGRSADLQRMACETGGEYFFLEDASGFHNGSDLQQAVQNRISGVWRLLTETSLGYPAFDPGGYLLSTSMTVTLGGKTRSRALQKSNQGSGASDDSRLWLNKTIGGN